MCTILDQKKRNYSMFIKTVWAISIIVGLDKSPKLDRTHYFEKLILIKSNLKWLTNADLDQPNKFMFSFVYKYTRLYNKVKISKTNLYLCSE